MSIVYGWNEQPLLFWISGLVAMTPYLYRSNLSSNGFPNLRPCFPHAIPFTVNWNHEILHDPDFPPAPGYISDDEAAILWECVRRVKGDWLEIGGHMGWSAAHIMIVRGVRSLLTMEPRFRERAFFQRWYWNMEHVKEWALSHREPTASVTWPILQPLALRSDQYSVCGDTDQFDGVFIDGDHNSPVPQLDAQFALARLKPRGVVVFHDFGGPVAEAVSYLIQDHGQGGMKCRVYDTPQMMAVCWHREFEPPEHTPDPAHREAWAARRAKMGFDFARCS